MSTPLIRPARVSDLEIVARFPQSPDELFYVHPTATFPLTAAQLQPNFQNRQGNTVVEVAGQVVAFANYIRVEPGADAVIGNVVVDPAQRGAGHGRRLLVALMEGAARQHGCRRALIPCFSDNRAGLLFYHRLGFEPLRWEIRPHPGGHPRVLFYLQRAI